MDLSARQVSESALRGNRTHADKRQQDRRKGMPTARRLSRCFETYLVLRGPSLSFIVSCGARLCVVDDDDRCPSSSNYCNVHLHARAGAGAGAARGVDSHLDSAEHTTGDRGRQSSGGEDRSHDVEPSPREPRVQHIPVSSHMYGCSLYAQRPNTSTVRILASTAIVYRTEAPLSRGVRAHAML